MKTGSKRRNSSRRQTNRKGASSRRSNVLPMVFSHCGDERGCNKENCVWFSLFFIVGILGLSTVIAAAAWTG